jgi:hypothetical protein
MERTLVNEIPTSTLEVFQDQLNNPNKEYKNVIQKNTAIKKLTKNIVLALRSSEGGCEALRNIFPMNYLNSVYGKSGKFNVITSPMLILQDDILRRCRSIFFQRIMNPAQYPIMLQYKELQKKYKFKMIYDIDDFLWDGPDDGEEIPEYNFGKNSIVKPVQDACVEIMKLCDTVCVSTKFLGDYIATKGIDKNKIKVVYNSLGQFFYGTDKRKPIAKKIEKPTVVWSASPTHWSDEKKLSGDMDNAWQEWVIKSVLNNKINFVQMGGLPWFFQGIKNKITVVDWQYSYSYHLALKGAKSHFGISPLVPNYFNYSKSPIKYQEYCAIGALGIGTTFSNGKPSPYDICHVKAPDTITVKEIDDLFEMYCYPDKYNDIISKQYQQLLDNSWYTESPGYVNMMLSIL